MQDEPAPDGKIHFRCECGRGLKARVARIVAGEAASLLLREIIGERVVPLRAEELLPRLLVDVRLDDRGHRVYTSHRKLLIAIGRFTGPARE
jgi:hypothetical protein